MKLTDKEKKLLYDMVNYRQCVMLERMKVHLDVLEKMGKMATLEWINESNQEWHELQELKKKLKT